MPDSTPATIGQFTYGDARRTQLGGPTMGKGGYSVTDVYTVFTHGGAHPLSGNGVSGIPEIGDEWDIQKGKGWECTKIQWKNTFPNEYWLAEVTYTTTATKMSQEEDPDPDPGPTPIGGGKFIHREFQPAAWSFDCEYDAGNGRAVMNTAGDRFQDALTKQVYTTNIIIRSIEPAPPYEALAFQGTINSTEKTIAGITVAPHCGLLTISAVEGDDPDYPWNVTYTVQVCTNPMPTGGQLVVFGGGESGQNSSTTILDGEDAGYDAVVLNAGYRYVKQEEAASASSRVRMRDDPAPTTRELVRFRDKVVENGVEKEVLAVDPHVLDPNGYPADNGSGYTEDYWTKWQRYPAADWGNLLPTDVPVPDDDDEEEDGGSSGGSGE